jgi:hypothetical protein
MKSLWIKIKDNYNRITRWVLIGLFVILYSPFILIEYFSEKIEEEVKDINFNHWYRRETEDVIKKKLIRFGYICLSIGLLIGFIIGFLI